ncbi:DNA mismatch repair protein MutS2 [Lutibacter agarilyticus]|uniref:DNA mismatch repair protein MutS2 n=1 Tax=Lutibacter agarilyticus TaxID=1109740 RepID=A0A238WVB9_9FLAO|nr:DNA mismatch repair protein MutS [Lutibacter agarilyticus]SNR50368.1 DNA mismatch repair protein MutS2 [Lutibacter agarilyticus]
MSNISEKTLIDLEFFTILKTVSEFCISDLGKKTTLEIKPFQNKVAAQLELNQVNEYLSSYVNDNRIPNHYFDDIQKEIYLLKIENSYLEPAAFLKILNNTNTIFELLKFFKKFKDIYPTLFMSSEEIEYQKIIAENINKIITSFGEVSENASPLLKSIRKEINAIRAKIGSSFTRALSQYNSAGYLDDIRESVIDNQRVLAVMAMHRRKVKGSLVGSSKTGSIVYIAPEATLQFTRELQNLAYEEHQEIVRILKDLTNSLREFVPNLNQFQNYLITLDVIASKATYANKINACLPKITSEKKVFFRDAYHPILFLKNNEQQLKTVPQTLELNSKQQIIVISGPNAGGKSITLKTVGLLQVMLQSGFLIPVHERSETYFFEKILTDIGDNQSIENQLSTYSYRLKNMRNFLRSCNDSTLFLIDEFGTGSDPELGGALAEIFLEEFYYKKAFGIITTHYANLKVLASELENVANANMHFDEKTLEPLFKLFIGQAGSSFTFEVAQKNGIPFSLINKAKKRVEGEKVRLDKTISKLQKERNKLQHTSETLEKEKSKAVEQTDNLTEKQQKIQEKLEGFQELYDRNQKMLYYGRKFNELVNKYFQTNNKKAFTADLNKWVAIEKTKHLKKNPPKPKTKAQKKQVKVENKKVEEKLKVIEKEVVVAVEKVRVVKEIEAKKVAKQKADYVFKVGDRVKIMDSNSTGIIEKIEKKNAFINYGFFTTKTTLNKLELVQAAKK